MLSLPLLFILQIIWTSSYVAMKFSLESMPVGTVLIFRYGIASLVFLLFGYFRGVSQFSKRDWLLVIGVGIANYTCSPFFQLKGLALTQVMDVSVMVATEPLITALMASLILREKLTLDLLTVCLISIVGIFIISDVNVALLTSPMTGGRLLGNLLFILALCFEGFNTIVGRSLTQRHKPLTLVAWMHLSGFVTNLLFNFPLLGEIAAKPPLVKSWVAVVYLGIFCSAIGYGTWYILVQKVPVIRLSLSLFLQPVIGIFLGCLVMGEDLNQRMLLGAGLILGTLFVWVLKDNLKNKIPPTLA